MQDACRYADRPFAFLARYVKVRPIAHAAIVIAVVAAVGCSVGAQYGVKILVDTLAGGFHAANARDAWLGFLLLTTLIAADNFLWRGAGWGAPHTPLAPPPPPRPALFPPLSPPAPRCFAPRTPPALSRP